MRQEVSYTCSLDNSADIPHIAPTKETFMTFQTPNWDLALLGRINQSWQNPLLDSLMPMLSSEIFLWIATLTLIAAGLRYKIVGVTVILSLGISIAASDLACTIIKEGVGRVRPYHSVAGTRYLDSETWTVRPQHSTTTKHRGSSFPSAHAANSAAAALVLFATLRKKAIWLIPLFIGYSRVYVGKHYPVDVLAGWAIGLIVAGMLLPLYPKLWERFRSRWIR
jgi:undecaprenyl-diphosphatase